MFEGMDEGIVLLTLQWLLDFLSVHSVSVSVPRN